MLNLKRKKTKRGKVILNLPDGWKGPIIGYYLPKNVITKSFNTFIEAIEAANEIDSCKGITMDQNGAYKLRCMAGGKPVKSTKNDTSWIKSTIALTSSQDN